RSLSITHTILAPVYLMENLFNPWNAPALQAGTLPSPIPVDLRLQQLAIADLATFAALAIERPDEFAGRRIALASDALTAVQAAAHLSRLIERPIEARQLPADALTPGLRALFAWLEHAEHSVDLQALRLRYPDVGWHDYPGWLRSQRPRLCGLAGAV